MAKRPRPADRPLGGRQLRSNTRKCLPCRLSTLFLVGLGIVLLLFLAMGLWQLYLWHPTGGPGALPAVSEPRPPGTVLRFVPSYLMRRLDERIGLDRLRSERSIGGVRPPRLALVTGSMDRESQSLMLLTLVKGLKELGYSFTVFALGNGEAYPLWGYVGCPVSMLNSAQLGSLDWSNYEGVILSSLEAKQVIWSLMQEPFDSTPVIWLVQEDTLGKRLPSYEEQGWKHLITTWRNAFRRADVVVFPDFFLPMLYTSLDTGNFYVISGSPVDVWGAKSFMTSHSRVQLRKDYGFNEEEMVVVVIGSYFFYNELPCDHAAVMHAFAREVTRALGGSIKFVFVCGNSTETRGSKFEELENVRNYDVDSDVDGLLLMADIVLYGSFQEEQTFPPLLVRAMSLGTPIIVPDLAIIKKYVVEDVHGLFFTPTQPDTLAEAFSLLISDKKLSSQAHIIANNGKLLSENMLALDFIVDYTKLLENVVQFPSEVVLPGSTPQIQQKTWLWDLLDKEPEQIVGYSANDIQKDLSIVGMLEEEFMNITHIENATHDESDSFKPDFLTEVDWDNLSEMEFSEDIMRREMQEHEERMEKSSGSWEEVYRNTKKAEKLKAEASERDEGELERTGQPLCIYEIYNGEGAWPFLHHGSLYRGLSLLKRAQRSRSDDVDAVGRLPILNNTYFRDLLCELGAIFSVANRIDSIHKIPWIGFQSWRAAGKKVSLSGAAEKALEDAIQEETKGDVVFYWTSMNLDQNDEEKINSLDFWSICDILNAGYCRAVFEDTFREMYGLGADMAALPPMPNDGEKWSSLHCWVMPTPSFLEFVMFSRMFVNSLRSLNLHTSIPTSCVLGSSQPEKRHCYCRLLELLLNVWAYHSARRMVYLNPITGEFQGQHPIEQRKGLMWVKYFNSTLMKSMDEDLAEGADDSMHLSEKWMWPFTGEVHWQGILDREREERYRRKMDKKRKTKEKLLDRQKHGYKQKPIGANRN